jgi:hypothetical protein
MMSFLRGDCAAPRFHSLPSPSRGPCWVLATVTWLAVPGPAFGQRADENAVTASQDAFGTSIGFQNVGLYSANDARGFSHFAGARRRIVSLPLFRTRDLGTQDWTTWGWRQTTFGAVVKSALGDHWKVAAGLFTRWSAIRLDTIRI